MGVSGLGVLEEEEDGLRGRLGYFCSCGCFYFMGGNFLAKRGGKGVNEER